MASDPPLERRSSRGRLLSKQDEVEEADDDDHSPSSETSDATVVAGTDTPTLQTPAGSGSSGDNSPDDKKTKDEQQQQGDKETAADQTVYRDDDEDNGLVDPEEGETDDQDTPAGNSKVKVLVRSHALRDDSSPPPEENRSASPSQSSNTLAPQPKSSRGKLEKDNSQGSDISCLSGSSTRSPCLSRDSSLDTQYTDSTGIDLEEFIKMTLNKNVKDRMMLLKLEQDLTAFIKDQKKDLHKFAPMTSYHRMLVHRVAAFFGLEHNVDPTGKAVIVNKTTTTRIPDFKFRDHLREEGSQDESQPKRQILKRGSGGSSFEDGKDGRSPDRGIDGKRQKSFEERAEEYEQARARIFNDESMSSQEGVIESPASSRPSTRQSSARSSKEDLHWNTSESRQWSSTDSSGYGTDSSGRVSVTKASSFGGVTVLSRGDSRSTGRLSKTDSLSSGLSSTLTSPMSRPPPIPSSPPPEGVTLATTGTQADSGETLCSKCCGSLTDNQQLLQQQPLLPQQPPSVFDESSAVVWVASSLDTIPTGAMLINPQTWQPYQNPDGSLYRYQPQQHCSHLHHHQQQQQLSQLSSANVTMPPNFLAQQQKSHTIHQQQSQHNLQQQYSLDSTSGSELTQQFSSLSLSSLSSLSSDADAGVVNPGHHMPPSNTFTTSPPQPQSSSSSQYHLQQVGYPHNPMGVPPNCQQQSVGPTTPTQTMPYMYPVSFVQQPSSQQQSPLDGQLIPSAHQTPQTYLPNYQGFPMINQMPHQTSTPPASADNGYYTYQIQHSEGICSPQPYQPYPPVSISQTLTYPQTQTAVPPTFYSMPSTTGSQVITYSAAAPSVPALYRAKTPPGQQSAGSQTIVFGNNPAVGCTIPQAVPSVCNVVNSLPYGTVQVPYPQPPPPPTYAPPPPLPQHVSPSNQQQQQQQQQQQLTFLAKSQPQPGQQPQQQSLMAFQPTMPPNAACFPVIRQNMQQLSMQPMTASTPQTTPPPPIIPVGGSIPPHTFQAGMKMYPVDQRGMKPQEGICGQIDQRQASNAIGSITPPILQKTITSPMAPGGVIFRPAAPTMNPVDLRMLGQPIHQFRPALQPLTLPRQPRMMCASTAQQSSSRQQKTNRRTVTRMGSRDIPSPRTTPPDTSGMSAVLEIFDAPGQMKFVDVDNIFDDIRVQGAKVHQIPDAANNGKNIANLLVSQCTLLAQFPSPAAAETALANHTSSKYKLRPCTRPFILPTS